MDLRATYKNKKVLVTGHTGFKGSWLITWLYSLGAIVKGYALEPENKFSLFNEIGGSAMCESVIADIRDKERIKAEILDFEPDFIFHLAAQPLVRLSYQIPVETFDINSLGTANLLDALRFLEKPCISVMITTDKVYQNLEVDYAYKEDDKLGGHDPYSASKAIAEIIVDSYRNSFFNVSRYDEHKKSISTARAGNVIGGGDWAMNRIIPDIVRALQNRKSIELRNPKSIRPWQHVLEPLHGYLILGAHQQQSPRDYATAFNLGPHQHDAITVEEIVQRSIKYWGNGNYNSTSNNGDLHEANLLQLDISKALKMLNWQPKMNADEAIRKTIEWYKDRVVNKLDARQLISAQIKQFIDINDEGNRTSD